MVRGWREGGRTRTRTRKDKEREDTRAMDPGKDRVVHCLGSLAIERKPNASEPNLSAVV